MPRRMETSYCPNQKWSCYSAYSRSCPKTQSWWWPSSTWFLPWISPIHKGIMWCCSNYGYIQDTFVGLVEILILHEEKMSSEARLSSSLSIKMLQASMLLRLRPLPPLASPVDSASGVAVGMSPSNIKDCPCHRASIDGLAGKHNSLHQ